MKELGRKAASIIVTTCLLKHCPSPGWKIVPFSWAFPDLMGVANFPVIVFISFLLLFALIKAYWP